MQQETTFQFYADGKIFHARMSYDRAAIRYAEKVPFSDKTHPVETNRAIIGSLAVTDENGKSIGTLRFTEEGLRYDYVSKADGKEHTLPMRRLMPESELVFIADDDTFQSHFLPMLITTIAQHHQKPEELERHISATCQSAPKFGQAIGFPLRNQGRDGEERGFGP